MTEKLKTTALIVLLITGLYLTQKVWFQIPEIQEINVGVEEVNLLDSIITPEKYIIHFGQGDFTIIYDDSEYDILERAKDSLKYLFSSDDIKISQEDYEKYSLLKEEGFIEFILPQAMNSYILAASLDIEDLNDIVNEVHMIERIFLNLNKDGNFLLVNGEDYLLVEDKNLSFDTIRDQIKVVEMKKNYTEYELIDDIYIPKDLKISIPDLSVSNLVHSLDSDERNRFAERFFSREIDYIREIVESNGSYIYEYDNKVLKLNSNGVIEYFHSLDDNYPESNLYISLTNAVDFLKTKVGLEKDIFLSQVERIETDNNKGYSFYFRYRTNYIPLLVGDGYKDYIQVDVFNNQVSNFHHLANEGQIISRSSDLNRSLISPEEIIRSNEDIFTDQDIRSIDISYFDNASSRFNQTLQLVWVFEGLEGLYAFDAYNGNLVYER